MNGSEKRAIRENKSPRDATNEAEGSIGNGDDVDTGMGSERETSSQQAGNTVPATAVKKTRTGVQWTTRSQMIVHAMNGTMPPRQNSILGAHGSYENGWSG